MSTISRRTALTLLGMTGASIALAPTISLAAPKTIVCNWDKDFPPYSWNRNGAMTGILVDCMDELLGKRMGFTLEHRGLPWEEAQDGVRSGDGDALCTNPTDIRQQYMKFSEEPVVESLPSIFSAVDNPRRSVINTISTLEDLKGFRQVDYKGNGWAQRTFPPYLKITYLDTLSDVFTHIARGEADLFVGNGLAAMYTIKTMGLKDKITARELPVGEPSSFFFGLRADYPEVARILADYEQVLTEAMLDGVTRKIVLNYL